jgi:hypothetical protein
MALRVDLRQLVVPALQRRLTVGLVESTTTPAAVVAVVAVVRTSLRSLESPV